MDANCMAEMTKLVKGLRREASDRLEREGRHLAASYDGHGEMRAYRKVLELICPDPMKD